MRIRGFAVLLLCLASPLLAGEKTIDLSKGEANVSQSVAPGTEITIVIANHLYKKENSYRVIAEVRPQLEVPLTVPIQSKTTAPSPGMVEPCEAIEKTLNALGKIEDEQQIDEAINDVKKAAASPECAAGGQAIVAEVEERTTMDLDSVVLREGEVLTVEIERLKVDGTTARKWTRRYSSGIRGEWLTSYGLLFVPNGDEEFFSKDQGNGTFKITEMNDHEEFDYLPTLVFNWIPRSRMSNDWVVGPAVGIGSDLSSITAIAGISFIYNHNVGFTVALAMHPQSRLNGQFKEDEIVKQSLDSKTLVSATHDVNISFGITVRSLTALFN